MAQHVNIFMKMLRKRSLGSSVSFRWPFHELFIQRCVWNPSHATLYEKFTLPSFSNDKTSGGTFLQLSPTSPPT